MDIARLIHRVDSDNRSLVDSDHHHLMDIARVLNRDGMDPHPSMGIGHLLNPDDLDPSIQEPSTDVATSQVTALQKAPTSPPPSHRSVIPASHCQVAVTPMSPPRKPSTQPRPPKTSLTRTPPLEKADIPPPPSQRTETPAASLQKSTTPAPSPRRTARPAPRLEDNATAAPLQRRAVARARPPRPRKPSIASLRAQVEAFQIVVDNLPYVLRELDDTSPTSTADSNDDEPDIAGDPGTKRIRSFLKRTIVLTKEAQEEIAIRTEYLRMLKRHYEGVANLRKLMRGLPLDDWFWMCERWRELTLQYYEPLSEERCYEIVQETLLAINAHKLPDGTKETGGFGWRDWVHLDTDGQFMRFTTRKTLHTDMDQIVDHTWSHYTDGDLYRKARLGDNCELFHQVLQEISPDVMIIQRVEKFSNLEQLTHTLAIAFRVQTETGYIIAFRCIESPRLQSLMKAQGLSLCGTFGWDIFDVAHRDAQGVCDEVRLTVAGSIGSDNKTYARRWHNEILAALVRYETQLSDTPVFAIDSSIDGGDAAIDSQAT